MIAEQPRWLQRFVVFPALSPEYGGEGGKTANKHLRLFDFSLYCLLLLDQRVDVKILYVCVCLCVCVCKCELWTQSAQSLAKCAQHKRGKCLFTLKSGGQIRKFKMVRFCHTLQTLPHVFFLCGSFFFLLPSLLIRFSQVVQQQKAECSQKLEGLSMWLAGAASLLASQKAGAESDDVNVLQEKQKKLKVLNFYLPP